MTVGVARHSYAMTIVYLVAAPATALIAVVSFLVGATAIGFVFPRSGRGLLLAAEWWQANIGHRTFSRALVSDAAEALDAPEWLIVTALAGFTIVLGVVVPALAIVGIAT